MAKHSRRTPRRRVWPYLTGALATAVAVALLGWTITGALGRPVTELIARTAGPAPVPSPAVTVVPPPAAGPSASATVADPDASPLAGRQLWLEPETGAAWQAAEWTREGRIADAAAMRRIAAQPQAVWFADGAGGFAARAAALAAAAERAGRLPVLVAYYLPGRDCRDEVPGPAGGAATADAYSAWLGALAEALEGREAVVVLEPGAVAQAVDGCLGDPADDAAAKRAVSERFRLLGAAVDQLKVNSGVRVYIDAGNPSWVQDLDVLADALRTAGVERADGFALNVGGFETTADNIAYGLKLSKRLDDAHFVVDTSRNGNGPSARGRSACNPPGRALGDAPSTWTGQPRVDAYLWVKRPGESDGACGGAPRAGLFWAEYALDLATN